MRVLVVDRDPDILELIVHFLETLGHDAVSSVSADVALTICRFQADIDLLITEIALPGMTGIQLAQKAIESIPDLMVILMTGLPDYPGMENVVPLIRKPFQIEDLRESIGRLFRL